MAIHDNSFEQQMIDFYGIDNIGQVLEEMSDGCPIKEKALMQIGFDIVMKYDNISKDEMKRQKNIIQIELYSQLENDRNKKSSNNSIDNLTWVDKKDGE